MISTLTFKIEKETVEEEFRDPEPFMRVHVIPLIDGKPYIDDYKSYPFEPLSVYAMDFKDGEVWPFNCECGVHACARMDEPAMFTVETSTVRWQLPEEPFVELAVDQGGTSRPRSFTFDRAQYGAAFQALIAELRGMEKEHGTLKIHPIHNRRRALDEEIAVEKNWAEYRRILRAALGELDHERMEFVVRTSDGLELSTSLYQLIYTVTREFLVNGLYDLSRTQEAVGRLGEALRSDPSSLLRQLDVHWLSAHLRACIISNEDEDDEPASWPAPYWTGPESPPDQIEYWMRVQQAGTVTLRRRTW